MFDFYEKSSRRNFLHSLFRSCIALLLFLLPLWLVKRKKRPSCREALYYRRVRF